MYDFTINDFIELKLGRRTEACGIISVKGGGPTGQSGAALLGIARALIVADPNYFSPLRDGGYLTRDSRMVERKKYGQKKARKRFQFSKR